MVGLTQEQLREMRERCENLREENGSGGDPRFQMDLTRQITGEDIPALLDELERVNAELSTLKADMETGRLVRVVRCKDCKNGVNIKGVHNIACEDSDGYCDPDDYCMYGEMRDAPVVEQEEQNG